jgi:hypothetical protein
VTFLGSGSGSGSGSGKGSVDGLFFLFALTLVIRPHYCWFNVNFPIHGVYCRSKHREDETRPDYKYQGDWLTRSWPTVK